MGTLLMLAAGIAMILGQVGIYVIFPFAAAAALLVLTVREQLRNK